MRVNSNTIAFSLLIISACVFGSTLVGCPSHGSFASHEDASFHVIESENPAPQQTAAEPDNAKPRHAKPPVAPPSKQPDDPIQMTFARKGRLRLQPQPWQTKPAPPIDYLLYDLKKFYGNYDYRNELAATRDALIGGGGEFVPRLCRAASEHNRYTYYVRREIVSILGEIGDASAVEPLMEIIANPNGPAEAAAQALMEIGQYDVQRIIRLLDSPDLSVQRNALRALEFLGDETAVEPLIRTLERDDPGTLTCAARTLSRMGDRRAVEPLIRVLNSRNPENATHLNEVDLIARALADLGDQRAVEPFQLALKRYPNRSLIDCLEKLKKPHVVDTAVQLTDSERPRDEEITDRDVRRVPTLIGALYPGNTPASWSAARELGRIRDPRAIAPLILNLGVEDQFVTMCYLKIDGCEMVTRRRTLLEQSPIETALAKIGGPAIAPLLPILKKPKHPARFGAIRVVARLQAREASDPLLKLLLDPFVDFETFRLVIAALGEVGDGKAVYPLLQIVAFSPDADDQELAQHPAATAIGRIGLDAIDPLIAALDDEDQAIRKAAAALLKEIGEPRALAALTKSE
jgi:HEAT repeat protein